MIGSINVFSFSAGPQLVHPVTASLLWALRVRFGYVGASEGGCSSLVTLIRV